MEGLDSSSGSVGECWMAVAKCTRSARFELRDPSPIELAGALAVAVNFRVAIRELTGSVNSSAFVGADVLSLNLEHPFARMRDFVEVGISRYVSSLRD